MLHKVPNSLRILDIPPLAHVDTVKELSDIFVLLACQRKNPREPREAGWKAGQRSTINEKERQTLT